MSKTQRMRTSLKQAKTDEIGFIWMRSKTIESIEFVRQDDSFGPQVYSMLAYGTVSL